MLPACTNLLGAIDNTQERPAAFLNHPKQDAAGPCCLERATSNNATRKTSALRLTLNCTTAVCVIATRWLTSVCTFEPSRRRRSKVRVYVRTHTVRMTSLRSHFVRQRRRTTCTPPPPLDPFAHAHKLTLNTSVTQCAAAAANRRLTP